MSTVGSYKGGQQSILSEGLKDLGLDDLEKTGNLSGNLGKAAGYVGAAAGFVKPITNLVDNFNEVKNVDIDELLPEQSYNPYVLPEAYEEVAVPDSISKGAGNRSFFQNAPETVMSGVKLGNKIGGPIGGAVGGGLALIGTAVAAGKIGRDADFKRVNFNARQEERYRDYKQANQQHYDLLGTQTRSRANAKSIAKRGQNVVPYYNSSIYGYV